jgi:hypothetical protein
MEESLIAFLLASTGLAALVGTRITWHAREQGAGLPAVVLHLIDRVPVYSDEGHAGLDATRVQINCLATDATASAGKSKTILVARAVRAALSSVAMTYQGVTFQGVFPDIIDQDLTPEIVGGVTVYGRSLDYQLWHLT